MSCDDLKSEAHELVLSRSCKRGPSWQPCTALFDGWEHLLSSACTQVCPRPGGAVCENLLTIPSGLKGYNRCLLNLSSCESENLHQWPFCLVNRPGTLSTYAASQVSPQMVLRRSRCPATCLEPRTPHIHRKNTVFAAPHCLMLVGVLSSCSVSILSCSVLGLCERSGERTVFERLGMSCVQLENPRECCLASVWERRTSDFVLARKPKRERSVYQ